MKLSSKWNELLIDTNALDRAFNEMSHKGNQDESVDRRITESSKDQVKHLSSSENSEKSVDRDTQ